MASGKPLAILVFGAVDGTHRGGVQTVAASLAQGLRRVGHRVRLAWSAPTVREAPGLAIWRLHVRTGPDPMSPPRRRMHAPSLWMAIRNLAHLRPDLVHVHFVTPASYYFLLLRPLFGFRLVLTAHGSDLLRPLPDSAPYLRKFLRRADAVTVVSADLRDRAQAIAGRPDADIHLIRNGVDTDFWSPTTDEARDARTIVAVGRLEPVKGFDVLLDAFAAVLETVPDARLVLIGEGGEAHALADRAAALGISARVIFEGGLPADAVRAALRGAAVYVLSSRSEGMPLALIEAMACRLPCVVTDVGGVREIVGDSAMLVPPEDRAALARALVALLTDRTHADRLAGAARERSLAFSSSATVAAYEKVYRDVLRDRSYRAVGSPMPGSSR